MAKSSVVTREHLVTQLAAAEKELEMAKAYLYRMDGVIQVLKQLIATPETKTPAPTATP